MSFRLFSAQSRAGTAIGPVLLMEDVEQRWWSCPFSGRSCHCLHTWRTSLTTCELPEYQRLQQLIRKQITNDYHLIYIAKNW